MKWEYKVAHIQAIKWTATGLPNDLGEQFDRWGDDGWELVRIEPIHRSGMMILGCGSATRTEALVAFFKRPVDRESEPDLM